MANWVSQQLGKVNKELLDLTQDGSSVLTSPVNKLWRAAILLHRATHKPHQEISKLDPAKGKNVSVKERERNWLVNNQYYPGNPNHNPAVEFSLTPHDELIKSKPANSNQIILYNITSKPYEYIVIQNRPNKLEFKGETTWAAIKSMGRNTPMYHYTGSEDTVQFNISWFCDDAEHRDEVVNKCRFLEAWSKSNAYQTSPPILMIQWGDSEIFKDHYYILISATYTLENFNDHYRHGRSSINGRLLPSTATQELIFKRVSSTNLSWNDILPKNKMDYTRGLNKQ